MEEKSDVKKNIIAFVVIIFLTLCIIVIGNRKFQIKKQEDLVRYNRARVIEVKEESKEANLKPNFSEGDIIQKRERFFKAEITDKENKGKQIIGKQTITENTTRREVKVGDKVVISKNSEEEVYYLAEYDKTNKMMLLGIIFVIATILIGLWKGATTIISLALNTLLVFFVYIPAIVCGVNIYLATILLVAYVVPAGLILLNGINKKTLSAILGNYAGVIVSAILAYIANKVMYISGIVDENSLFLRMLETKTKIDLVAIVWAGIVIGSLGAIMDTAMSVASAIKEISDNMINKDPKQLIKSGMTVGRDAIGTMTNTLVLAYIGGALSTTILLTANLKDPAVLFNMEFVIVEILQAIIGSIGIIITVLLTVLISVFLETKAPKGSEKFIQKYTKGLSLKNKN